MKEGSKKVYGDPDSDSCRKLHMAVHAVSEGRSDDGVCGLAAAAEHTKLINYVQKNYRIYDVKSDLVREKEQLIYVKDLFIKALSSYKDVDHSLLQLAEDFDES